MRSTKWPSLLFVVVATGLFSAGCQSGGGTGALAGGGIGALAGQAIGGDTSSTLIGAGVGAGIGYLIGNEQDKKHARELSAAQPTAEPKHSEVGPLGGTRWSLISLVPKDVAERYASKIVEFRPDGHIVTTTIRPDGTVAVDEETYRVVGDTLIVNKPGYLINARFGMAGGQMTVSAERFSAVLTRLPS